MYKVKLREALTIGITCLSATFYQAAVAGPFQECPTEAFLTQSKPARLYGVDLTSGRFYELGDLDTYDKLNAMAFNINDGYLYAWFYERKTLARIHGDYDIEPLQLSQSLGSNYYIGDISFDENAYYIYRKSGTDHGLWRVPLDPDADDYLQVSMVISGHDLYLNIFDFAFHPESNELYSVDSRGKLWRITTAGVATNLGNVGQRGTFGAVYFDVEGTLYISRNKDGKIFSIDVDSASPTAEFFSYGPSSSNNDGARCMFAPVAPPEEPTMDFGDAPISYATRLSEDGARHIVGNSIYLGSSVDAENRAFHGPDESDDHKDDNDDEDGFSFISELNIGEDAIVSAQMAGEGYLSMWLDLNRNGSFDPDEKLIDDLSSLSQGSSPFTISIPADASIGSTWARVRYSSQTGLAPTGAASDGEVEDYEVELRQNASTTLHYPSADGYVTLAFEDLWPSVGDYDMNDFVVYYRTAMTTEQSGGAQQQTINSIQIEGEVVAVGASFHSGFAVSIPGMKTEDVDESGIELTINGSAPLIDGVPFSPLRGTVSRQDEDVVLEVTRDVWNIVERGEGCSFHRTESGCGAAANATFSMVIPAKPGVSAAGITPGLFNPFIFSTQGFLRNSIFKDESGARTPPGEGLEIHLKNRPASWRADTSILGRADDRSEVSTMDENNPVTYQNAAGLPWAIEVGGRWCHPGEYQDMTLAYPLFASFVLSEGETASDWFYLSNASSTDQDGEGAYLYKEDGNIDQNCAGGSND